MRRRFPLHNREQAEQELQTIAQTRLRWETLPIENIITVQEQLDQGYLHHWLQEFAEPEGERVPRIDRLLRARRG